MAIHVVTPRHIRANEIANPVRTLAERIILGADVSIAVYGEFVAIRNIPQHKVVQLMQALSNQWPELAIINTDMHARAA